MVGDPTPRGYALDGAGWLRSPDRGSGDCGKKRRAIVGMLSWAHYFRSGILRQFSVIGVRWSAFGRHDSVVSISPTVGNIVTSPMQCEPDSPGEHAWIHTWGRHTSCLYERLEPSETRKSRMHGKNDPFTGSN